MARRAGPGFGTLLTLLLLAGAGFAVGVVAGILWEEPRLVLSYFTGGTTEIAWREAPQREADSASVEPDSTAPAPVPEAAEPPARPAPVMPAPAPVAAAPPGRLAIQVGAFSSSESAERLAERLKGKGYPAYVTPSARTSDTRWRVRVGPLADADRAQQLAARLKREEKLPTWVLDDDGG